MTQRQWTVNRLETHSEVYCNERQSWIKASRHVAKPSGFVKATARTNNGERHTVQRGVGETWFVR